MMTAAYFLLWSSVVGQYPYYPPAGAVPGYGYTYPYAYGRTPLPAYDPMRYNRFYSGEGYYRVAPPVIANPEVITPARSDTPVSGTTGVVLAVNEEKKQITLQLPASKTVVAYGPTTHFLAADGNFPVIKPGNLINVNQNTITILRRSEPKAPAPQ
jgi:hypothetical protein